jgi:D-arabinose 1-dehydrogenase-like Zn-dependent alcohol dehydrogenase
MTGTLAEARELIDLMRAKAIAPPPIAERPLNRASETLDDLRAGKIVGRVVLKA